MFLLCVCVCFFYIIFCWFIKCKTVSENIWRNGWPFLGKCDLVYCIKMKNTIKLETKPFDQND